ncbi:MAG: DnaJ C-terminal domain-containing protein [Caldimicrobium sp.]
MMDRRDFFQNLLELKRFFRLKIKELHPDRGGNKEEYLKFIKWYQESLSKLSKKSLIKVLRNYFPTGNFCYRIETFTIKEVSLGLTKQFKLPLKEITCPTCKGMKKSLSGKKEICSKCLGKGFLSLSNNGESIQIKCSFCEGKGYLYRDICPDCLGKGKIKKEELVEIKLPFGLREGNILFISKEFFDSPWDFYIEVNLESHPFFKLQGDNLICEARIHFYEILLKDAISIETLEGVEEVPSEIFKKGEPVIFPGRGPYLSENHLWRRGDLIIYPKIIFPEKINEKAKKVLKNFVNLLKE